jgi:hypothetical protein
MKGDRNSKIFSIFWLSLSLHFLCGCGNKLANLQKLQQTLFKEQDDLYESYLHADAYHARRILEQKIHLNESQTTLAQAGFQFEFSYYIDYCRLYVLDKRIGMENNAELDFIKAKYWFIKSGERIGMPITQLGEEVRVATPEHIMEMISKQDKMNNNGKDPEYIKALKPPGSEDRSNK